MQQEDAAADRCSCARHGDCAPLHEAMFRGTDGNFLFLREDSCLALPGFGEALFHSTTMSPIKPSVLCRRMHTRGRLCPPTTTVLQTASISRWYLCHGASRNPSHRRD